MEIGERNEKKNWEKGKRKKKTSNRKQETGIKGESRRSRLT